MKKWLALVIMIPCLGFTKPPQTGISQYRSATESYQEALIRAKKNISTTILTRENPLNKKVPIREIDFTLAPTISTYQELMQMFYIIRDSRFLYDEERGYFPRRISWLYPDDGCYFRAAMSGIKLEHEQFIRPAKIFVFGDLMLQTPYSLSGAVYWWYHVAVVVKYMGTVYVLDPALKIDGPLVAEDWFNIMGSEKNLSGIVCNSYTYDPVDYCYKAMPKSDSSAMRDQSEFLGLEWQRMKKLDLDPAKILGDIPPWR